MSLNYVALKSPCGKLVVAGSCPEEVWEEFCNWPRTYTYRSGWILNVDAIMTLILDRDYEELEKLGWEIVEVIIREKQESQQHECTEKSSV